MVLVLRSKNRKGTSVQVDYVIHVQEIKPWPPSQSLKSLRSVLLQWENGDRSSGSLSPVGPTIGSGAGDGKIEFNESFKLPVILSREGSAKGGKPDVFQKNCLELNLYERRRDKTVKGQLLGSAMIDLAEYGMIKETIILSVPINCKRSFRNTAQPVLYVKIQPFDKDSMSASSRESQSKEVSMDKDGRESVSALMNEEYAEEAEIASFTDDDVSSHSSLNISSSAFETHADLPAQNDHFAGNQFQVENALEVVTESAGKGNGVPAFPLETVPAKSVGNPESPSAVYASNEYVSYQNRIPSQSSSMGLSFGTMSPQSDKASSNFPEINLMLNPKKASKQSSSSSIAFEAIDEEGRSNNETRSTQRDNLVVEALETDLDSKNKTKENGRKLVEEENDANCNGGTVQSLYSDLQVEKKPNLEFNEDEKDETRNQRSNKSVEGLHSNGKIQMVMEEKDEVKSLETEWEKKVDNACQATEFKDRIKCPPGNSNHTSVLSLEEIQFSQQSHDVSRKLVTSGSDTLTLSMRGLGTKGNSSSSDRPKHVKLPVRSSLGSVGSIEKENDDQIVEEGNENDILEDASYGSRSVITDKEIRENRSLISLKSSSTDKLKLVPREALNAASNAKVRQLEKRIETLEVELTESAAIELGLYSIVAEHGSSAKNVHTPARRLSRLYLHACKQWSKEKRASAARSAVTGLALVAKACGNDVPRLTFWLSNSVVLRAIITEAVVDSHLVSAGPHVEINGVRKNVERKSSSLKRKESTLSKKENKFDINFQDWGDPRAFTTALEKIEAWIFSRIIESVWWQTLTPYMQSTTQEGSEHKMNLQQGKNYGRKSSLGNQKQGNLSIDLWKKAFKDACARICPVRAEGHECGCLPFLARLVMEQCVARLDVAMFNAILRESEDEMPTDPVSDPISDSKVLPIPAGKSSFGAGAQLKNAIGNWSRWLTDLFGIDDDDSLVDEKESDNDRWHAAASFKPFHLLNALSDLLMLPKDMLLDRSIRKEVFPTFSAPLIKRVLESFVPDEFCPDPIPLPVLESLDSEDANEANEDSIQHFPCCASPIVYSPPSVASVSIIIGDLGSHSQLRRSRSSVLRKCHTSDDELDEVESPLTSILVDATRASPTSTASWKSKKDYGPNVVRYQLLREVWRDED